MEYWGKKDTSVSFCENKYEKSKYIAEFYNTISGSFYILVGLPFLSSGSDDVAVASIFLGIGTMLLHMTQRIYGQVMDELSMIILCYLFINRINKFYRKIYLLILITLYLQNYHNFLVFLSIFICELLILVYETNNLKKKKEVFYRKVFLISMSSGTVFWLLDQKLCSYVKNYQLHAYWHITTGISIFCGLKILN